jgi:trans-2,3-dihydro-3-hydroxyanthranilate isomerase
MLAYLVDAFTTNRFEGNPAGVILDADYLSREEKQKIAAEIRTSETAFVSRSELADFKIKFFTATSEVDYSGHATLAAFWLLCETGKINFVGRKATLAQETRAGIFPVTLSRRDGRIHVTMTQRLPQFITPKVTPKEVARALNIDVSELEPSFPIRLANTANWHLLIGVKSAQCLNNIKYDCAHLSAILSEYKALTAHVFCPEESGVYRARNFCPTWGVLEDPATGSAAGAFGAYLASQDLLDDGLNEVRIIQGEAMGRLSQMVALIKTADRSVTEVRVSGTAVLSFMMCADKEALFPVENSLLLAAPGR